MQALQSDGPRTKTFNVLRWKMDVPSQRQTEKYNTSVHSRISAFAVLTKTVKDRKMSVHIWRNCIILNSIHRCKCETLLETHPQRHQNKVCYCLFGCSFSQPTWHKNVTITHSFVEISGSPTIMALVSQKTTFHELEVRIVSG